MLIERGTSVRYKRAADIATARVVGLVPECCDGVVLSHVIDDHGASPEDPFHIVVFWDGNIDGFWFEELEALAS